MNIRDLFRRFFIPTIITTLFLSFLAVSVAGVYGQTIQSPLNDISWNANGDKLALAYDDGTVQIMDKKGGLVTTLPFAVNESIDALDWNPTNSNQLAISVRDENIKVIELQMTTYTTCFEINTFPMHLSVVRWSPDGTKIATSGQTDEGASSESAINIWNANDGTLLTTYWDGHKFTDINWNPQNSNFIALTGVLNNYGAEVIVWDVTQNQVVWQVDDQESGTLVLDWSYDGLFLATGTANRPDGTFLSIRNGIDGRLLNTINTQKTHIGDLDWSPNVNLAISVNNGIQIWDGLNYQLKTSITNTKLELAWGLKGDLAYRLKNGGIAISNDLGQLSPIATSSSMNGTSSK